MTKSIFISYNHNSQPEESTALRLQTISNLYGLSVSLPYRLRNISNISSETKTRIENSSFVVAFCIDGLTKLLNEELSFAISKNKPLIVIYDNAKGKKINFKDNVNVKEVFVDFTKTDDALHKIAEFLRTSLSKTYVKKTTQKTQNEDSGLGIALLGIGLGLLAAWSLSKENR
jgi:hypothetical protein